GRRHQQRRVRHVEQVAAPPGAVLDRPDPLSSVILSELSAYSSTSSAPAGCRGAFSFCRACGADRWRSGARDPMMGQNKSQGGSLMQPVSPRTATPRDAPMRAPAGITVTPLSPACGAEIGGVDLTRELSPATVQAIRQAWAEHLVLVFRGQDITQEQQLRFASYFGELGNRKKAPEPLRGRAEGVEQTHEKVLL